MKAIQLRRFRAALLVVVSLVFVAVAVVVAVGAVLDSSLKTPEQMLDYLVQHRQDISLASYTVRPDGTPDPTDPVLFVNADQKMSLASTFKIVVLAAYAREVVAGRLDPTSKVSIRDWERFYLPGMDGGAHPEALQDLGIPSDSSGFARDQDKIVTLDDLARVMIRFSDNAATDYLMAKLGRETLRDVITQAGLTGQDVPLPILGLSLSLSNHEDGLLTPARVRRLLAESPARYTARVDRLTAAYGNPKWRRAEHLFLATHKGFNPLRGFNQFRLGAPLIETRFQQGTARDYAHIMARVVTGTFLSPQISVVMRRHLERKLANHDTLLSWGFKGGSLPGVLTEANFFIPVAGDFNGKPRISVLFLRRLSLMNYFLLLDSFAEHLFAERLAIDDGFLETVQQALSAQ